MPSLAVFLGAGASKPLGYPLTREFLPIIMHRLREAILFREGSADEGGSNRSLLRDCLERLIPGLEVVDAKKLPLITDLISLVDYSVSQGAALWPKQQPDTLIAVRSLFERALLEILLKPPEAEAPESRRMGQHLCEWLLKQRTAGINVSLISTNYDVAVEGHLYQSFRSGLRRPGGRTPLSEVIDFGTSWLDPGTEELCEHQRPKDPMLRIFKLHGSLNWLRCACCENIYINEYGSIAHNAYRDTQVPENTCDCGHSKLRMHIVAPSLFREVSDPSLLQIWRAALMGLWQAEEWLIVGYSFPPEDIAIRSLFTRAYNVRSTPPIVRVVQHGTEAEDRYRAFFPNCSYEAGGLEALFV